MTISSSVRIAGPYTGAGSVSVYPFAFKVFQASDVLVKQTDLSGNITTLTLTTDYSVSLSSDQNANPGGSINLNSPLPNGYQLIISSRVGQLQGTSLTNNGGFYPNVIENALDYLTILVQQMQTALSNALQLPITVTGVSTTLPTPQSSQLIGWNTAGTALQNVSPTTLATQIAYGASNADLFTGNGSQTAFTLSANPGSLNNLKVAVAGATLSPGIDYTWSGGTTLTFTTAPANGAKVVAQYDQGLFQGYINATNSYFTQLGSTVQRTVQSKLQDIVNVADFGAKADGVTDDTVAIQNAINATAYGGYVDLMPGTHKISATLSITRPITLRGKGMGTDYGPTFAASTKLSWAGGALPMIIFGANGGASSFFGGGLQGFQLEGNALASQCIKVKDCQHFKFEGLSCTYATTDAILFNNTGGQITGFGHCENIYIQLRGGATNGANGIHVNGTSTGADGVTLMQMNNIRIDHANGTGVLVENIGDAFTWLRLFTYRANTETGYGVWFSSTATSTAVCGGHVFIKPVITSGFLFSGAQVNNGTRIINANMFDLASGSVLVSGPGVADVVVESDLGQAYGRGLLGTNQHVSYKNDPMHFIRWDSTNGVLMTSAGNWITAASGGNIIDSGQIGGAVGVVTSATSSNSAYIQGSQVPDGFTTTGGYLALDMIVRAVQTTNVKNRFGLMDVPADPVTNGIYFELDTSVNANYSCVCTSASTSTRVTTAIGPGAIGNFFMCVQPGSVSFYYRASGAYFMTLLAVITSNIPTVPIAETFYVKTLASNTSRMDIYSSKLGFADEV